MKRGEKLVQVAVIVSLVLLLIVLPILGGCGGNGEETPAPEPTLTGEVQPEPPEDILPNSYENSEHGFALSYPEEWSEAPPWSPEALWSVISPDKSARVEVSADYQGEERSLSEFVASMKSEMGDYETELISEEETTLGDGTPAYEMVYTFVMMGERYKSQSVTVMRKTQMLMAYGMGSPADFDANRDDIALILSSFRLLPLEVMPTPAERSGEAGFYEDEEHGLSISYPKDWIETPPRAKEVLVSICAPDYFPGVQVLLMPVEEGKTAAEAGSEFAEQARSIYDDYELVSQQDTVLGDGTAAYEVVYIGALPGTGIMGMKVVLAIRGTECFWLQGYSSPEKFAEHESIIDEVIQSFRFTARP